MSFRPKEKEEPLTTIPKKITLGVVTMGEGAVAAVLVVALVFLVVWIASLVNMRVKCRGRRPSMFWILTLVLGLIPTGATQLAALVMAIYGLARPRVGCAPPMR